MDSFLLFLFDIFHQALFYVGTVFALGVLVFEKIYKPVNKRWFINAALFFLFIASFQAWLDEHRNTEAVIAQRAIDVSIKNACEYGQGLQAAYARGLETNNRRQQQTINDQREINERQQTAINSCVVSLGKMNPMVIAKTEVLVASVVHKTVPARFGLGPSTTTYYSVIVISTNHKTDPQGRLTCARPFTPGGPPALQMQNSGMLAPILPVKVSDHEYDLKISTTTAEWNVLNPIYMPVISSEENIGSCFFTPQ